MFHPLSKEKKWMKQQINILKCCRLRQQAVKLRLRVFQVVTSRKLSLVDGFAAYKSGLSDSDEPTRGIDIGTKTEIQKLVLDLADQGMAVAFISSEVEEMLRTCSRMGVLRDGKKVGEISGNELSQEGIMKAIAGFDWLPG